MTHEKTAAGEYDSVAQEEIKITVVVDQVILQDKACMYVCGQI